jgi:hypothetical protein
MDFLKWYFTLVAIVGLLLAVTQLTGRVISLEEQVTNRPLGNCLEISDLLRNRPYPPAHGVHSYSKPVPTCEVTP